MRAHRGEHAATARAQNVTPGGISFSHRGLVGGGRVDADKRDRLNETFGWLARLALNNRTWRRNADGSYAGPLYAQPDRGCRAYEVP